MKTYKRVIAVFVAFTFLVLLQASTMPLRADQAPDQAGTAVASPEQGPSFIEEEDYDSPTAKKKSILPVVLIGLGVAALAAVLVLVVLKTKYDITGSWTITWQYSGFSRQSNTITFTGDKKSGNFSIGSAGGTYTVDDKKVTWTYANDRSNTVYTGEFKDKKNMSGTMVSLGIPGTWSAVKKEAGATHIGHPSLTGKLEIK